MADPRAKALDLVRKLLRTAAASSGASDNERKTAAQTAVELIAKHDLAADLARPEPVPQRKRRPRPPGAPTWTPPTTYQQPPWPPASSPQYYPPPPRYYAPYSSANWAEGVAPKDIICAQCGRRIVTGEPIWYDVDYGIIHHNITCAE